MNTLEALKQYTNITADTGDVNEIRQWKPEEATTNPTLILKIFQSTEGKAILQKAYAFAQKIQKKPTVTSIAQACLVMVAKQILEMISGRVSIEVDARMACDEKKTVQAAKDLIAFCQQAGCDTHRILIKIAATWEGIQAAGVLEKQGIACNGTLIFHETQALACAQAGVTLISPFVGRIYDWYVAHDLWKNGQEDPGVESVRRIFLLLKSQGYPTEIMGASFRNIGEIIGLAGCDRLTIAPKFLQALSVSSEPVKRCLTIPERKIPSACITEVEFRQRMAESAMATEKLSEGIAQFAQAGEALNKWICAELEKTHRLYENE